MSIFLSEFIGDQQRSAKVFYDEETKSYIGEFFVDHDLVYAVLTKSSDIKHAERLAIEFVQSRTYQAASPSKQYLTEDGVIE